mgnify:CR=1 FL=1
MVMECMCERYGGNGVLHVGVRRRRQMCIEDSYSPECTALRGACAFTGHSLYDYVHPDADRHQAGEQPWTTPELLARRGRPWLPQDEPPVGERPAKQKRAA